jgi:hypothetical protein
MLSGSIMEPRLCFNQKSADHRCGSNSFVTRINERAPTAERFFCRAYRPLTLLAMVLYTQEVDIHLMNNLLCVDVFYYLMG